MKFNKNMTDTMAMKLVLEEGYSAYVAGIVGEIIVQLSAKDIDKNYSLDEITDMAQNVLDDNRYNETVVELIDEEL